MSFPTTKLLQNSSYPEVHQHLERLSPEKSLLLEMPITLVALPMEYFSIPTTDDPITLDYLKRIYINYATQNYQKGLELTQKILDTIHMFVTEKHNDLFYLYKSLFQLRVMFRYLLKDYDQAINDASILAKTSGYTWVKLWSNLVRAYSFLHTEPPQVEAALKTIEHVIDLRSYFRKENFVFFEPEFYVLIGFAYAKKDPTSPEIREAFNKVRNLCPQHPSLDQLEAILTNGTYPGSSS